MKSIAIYAFVLLSNMMCMGCNTSWNGIKGDGQVTTKNRSVGNFDGITVSGSFDVILVSGKEGEISIEAEENIIDYILTEVNGGTLEIGTKKGHSLNFTRKVTITVAFEDIEKARLTGSGSITSNETIKASNFNTSVTGSGDVILTIDAGNTQAQVTGSGDLKLMGKTNSFDCKVTGSGDIAAYGLKAKNADANVSGSGGIELHCSDALNARVTGSGDIYYQGNPQKRSVSTTGSGDIHSR